MSEMKPTPGEWIVSPMTPCRVDTLNGAISVSWSSNHDGGAREREAEANARLIAEAGTVHHETQCTPRQLVEQRDALVERVKELEEALRNICDEQDAQQGYASLAAYDQARAALSKSLPNTVAETTSGQAPAAGAGDVGEPEWKSEDFEVTLYPPMPTTGFLVGMPKGVKVLHKPTGLFATSEEERSQHRNRDVAWNKLQEMLADRTQAPAAIDARRAALAQKEQSP